MPVNGRSVALAVLGEVEEGAYLNLALKRRLRGMEEQERRFTSALVITTLENLGRIDYVIDYFTSGKRVHRLIRNILRLGVCQLMFFESVPESAAVNECVRLAERSPKRQLKGFVNAVLRNIAGSLGSVAYPSREHPAEFLSVMYSYPKWLAEKYIEDYGLDFAEEMLSYRKSSADTCVRANRLKLTPGELENKLQGGEFSFAPGRYVPGSYYIRNITAIERMSLFQKGLIAVQGEASMLAAMACSVRQGERVLDVCAAPGGKTACLAEGRPARLLAFELHEHRCQLMRENLERLGVEADLLTWDASQLREELVGQFDCVLVDAPCSALGLLYRKPDIKYNRQSGELNKLVEIQRSILSTCASYVRPGGRLVYSTCTINRQENEQNADWFLRQFPGFSEGRLEDVLPAPLMPRVKGGRLQLYPHLDEIDGFFIARFEREEKR